MKSKKEQLYKTKNGLLYFTKYLGNDKNGNAKKEIVIINPKCDKVLIKRTNAYIGEEEIEMYWKNEMEV